MTPANFSRHTAATVALAGLLATPATAGLFLLSDATTPAATAQAKAPSVRLDSQLVDSAGVIDDAREQGILSTLREGIKAKNVKLYIVFVDSMNADPESYASELRKQVPTRNVLVLAVDTKARQFGASLGESVPRDLSSEITNAATEHFADNDWTGGAEAAANVAAGKSSGGSGGLWLAGAGATALAGGAGAYAYSRRSRRRKEEAELQQARNITPGDTADLAAQPTRVLRNLADEELHSTDSSIRKGEEELRIATAEFGAERTRELSRAVAHSRNTLNEAYGLHQRIRSGLAGDDSEERMLLIEIISSCGEADKNLNTRAEKFAELRQSLIDAPQTVEQLWQDTIGLRTRLPQAEKKLNELKSKYSPELMSSISDNVSIADKEIDHAEAAIGRAREILAQPAGKQGGLVDALGAARMATNQADRQLGAIERAEEQLAAAQHNLPALIAEVRDELEEARTLESSGAEIDRDGLAAAVQRAREALRAAETNGQNDPLGSYTELLEADAQLDIELDEARGADNTYRRTIDMLDRTIADVRQRLTAVEDTIHNRGEIISVGARSSAQAAHDALDRAEQQRLKAPKQAFLAANEASKLATTAASQAQEDINEFNRRNTYSGHGGGGGDLLTGVVLGSLLSGNGGFGGWGGGGFGGGWGGGDWGGGGFGGGDFGGTDSGSF